MISKLRESIDYRTAYVKSKLGVLVPSQVRALRLQSDMPRQSDLAKAAQMQQSRISMIETPGAANVTLETLARLAAAFRVGLIVKFVPLSEMLRWENGYSQNNFPVTKLDEDHAFLHPEKVNSQIPIDRSRGDKPLSLSAREVDDEYADKTAAGASQPPPDQPKASASVRVPVPDPQSAEAINDHDAQKKMVS